MAFSQQFAQDIQAYLNESHTDIPSSPAQLYIGLHSANPSPDCSVSELVGNGYTRSAITLESGNSVSTEDLLNKDSVVFQAATADWPAVSHYSIWDAQSSGKPYEYGAFDAPIAINNGTSFALSVNAIKAEIFTVPAVCTP
ncbi:MAG: hypothetical protein DRQ89_14500 [Epsilonproteobacteria bacterium]|nr:MAG: hypothetical protein DRQ89_14500 [Campylobacterota bacterium]